MPQDWNSLASVLGVLMASRALIRHAFVLLIVVLSVCLSSDAQSVGEKQAIAAIFNHWSGLRQFWGSPTYPCNLDGVMCISSKIVRINAYSWWGAETSSRFSTADLHGLSSLSTFDVNPGTMISNSALEAFLGISELATVSINGARNLTRFPKFPPYSTVETVVLSDMPALTELRSDFWNSSSSLSSVTLNSIGIAEIQGTWSFTTWRSSGVSLTLSNLPNLVNISSGFFKFNLYVSSLNFMSLPRLTELPSSLVDVQVTSTASLTLRDLPITKIPSLLKQEWLGLNLRSLPRLTEIPWLCNNWQTAFGFTLSVHNVPLDQQTIGCILWLPRTLALYLGANTTLPPTGQYWQANSLQYLELPLSWATSNLPPPKFPMNGLKSLYISCPSPMPFDQAPTTLESLMFLTQRTTHLSLFDAANCNLHGSIPSSFISLLYLQTVDLSYNQLSGTLPYYTRYIYWHDWRLDHNRLILCPYKATFYSTVGCYVSHNLGPCSCLKNVYPCADTTCENPPALPFQVTPSSLVPASPLPSCPVNGYLDQSYTTITSNTTIPCNLELNNLVLDLPSTFKVTDEVPLLTLAGCLNLKNELVLRLPYEYIDSVWSELMRTGKDSFFLPLISQAVSCGDGLRRSQILPFSLSVVYPPACTKVTYSETVFNYGNGLIGTYINVVRGCRADATLFSAAIGGAITAIICPLIILIILLICIRRREHHPEVPGEIQKLLKPI